MALQSYMGQVPYKAIYSISSTPSFPRLTSTYTRLAVVFRVPKTGQITHVKFRTGAVTTAQPINVSLKTVDANGDPTTTNYGGSSTEQIASPVSNTIYEVALTSPANATAGDWAAFVVEWAGTAGDLYIATASRIIHTSVEAYDARYSTSWGRNTQIIMLGIRYGGDGYIPCVLTSVVASTPSVVISTGTSPNELGNKFVLPFPARIAGALWLHVSLDTGAHRIVLYNSSLQEVASSPTVPTNYLYNADAWGIALFNTPYDAGSGTYYLTIQPTTTSTIKARAIQFDSNSDLLVATDGYDVRYVSRTGSGAFTEDNTRYAVLFPILSAFDDASGGGGGGSPIINPFQIIT